MHAPACTFHDRSLKEFNYRRVWQVSSFRHPVAAPFYPTLLQLRMKWIRRKALFKTGLGSLSFFPRPFFLSLSRFNRRRESRALPPRSRRGERAYNKQRAVTIASEQAAPVPRKNRATPLPSRSLSLAPHGSRVNAVFMRGYFFPAPLRTDVRTIGGRGRKGQKVNCSAKR